jgi:putative oxidoreductase
MVRPPRPFGVFAATGGWPDPEAHHIPLRGLKDQHKPPQEVQTMDTNRQQQIAFLIGRVMVGGMYLGAGIMNLVELDSKAGYAASKGLPDPKLWVTLASLPLVAAGLSFISGIRPRIGVGAIILFLISVTLIMHNFWAAEGMQRISEMHSFLGNLALLGSALMFLAIPRPWSFSLENWAGALSDMVRRRWATHMTQS